MKKELEVQSPSPSAGFKSTVHLGRSVAVRPPTISGLVRDGYLPKELPPCFTAEPLSGAAASLLRDKKLIPTTSGEFQTLKHSNLIRYSMPLRGQKRRKLAIANPKQFLIMAKLLVSNWKQIAKFCDAGPYGLSKPIRTDQATDRRADWSSGRHVSPSKSYAEFLDEYLRRGATFPYVAHVDIENYYGSIYTHSLCWAVHGHRNGMKKKPPEWSAALDRCLQVMQQNRTSGIPIGPDSSLVASEVLLAGIDREIEKRASEESSFELLRYMDDYYIFAKTKAVAEGLASRIQAVLNEYHLGINEKKSKVYPQPHAQTSDFALHVRSHPFARGPGAQRADIDDFFLTLNGHQARFEGSTVIDYGLKRMRTVMVHEDNWGRYQSHIVQTFLRHPQVIPLCLEQVLAYRNTGYEIDMDQLGVGLNALIERSFSNHEFELTWALWGLRFFDLKLDASALGNDLVGLDALSSVLLLDLIKAGRVRGVSQVKAGPWIMAGSLGGPSGAYWPLLLEACLHSWDGRIKESQLNTDSVFAHLLKNQIHLYDATRPLPVHPDFAAGLEAGKPGVFFPESKIDTTGLTVLGGGGGGGASP